MRKVWLNREDFGLFHQDITPFEYEFFRAHSGAFKRMWQEQTRRFWGVFVNTFEQFIWKYGIMKDFPMKAEDIHEYIDEIIFYIRDQFVDGKASTAKNLIMDSVIVTQNRHCIAMLDKASYAQNPFYMKETREIFRQLFGPPNSKRTFMKVLCGLPVYIKFAGSAVMLLRRWLDAEDIPSEDEDGRNEYFRNIHCRGGRRSEEPLSLEVALAHFKEKEREKKLAVAASRIGEMVSSKEGKKPKHGSSGTSGKEASIKVKTDQGTQTGPNGAVGGTVKEANKDLLTAATGKDPATGEKFGQESVACGSDSELLGDGKDKESRKKRRKKHKSKTGSSTESKKAMKETDTDTFNESKGSGDPGKAPLVSEGGKGDSQVDSGGDKRDSRVTSERGKDDTWVNSEKNSKMDTGEGKGDVTVDSEGGKGEGPGGGEGKGEEPVARDSGDTETAAAGSGKKKLHVCACCGLAETLAKTFKRCQKCRGKPNPKYYCSRECQVKHWKTHKEDHKED